MYMAAGTKGCSSKRALVKVLELAQGTCLDHPMLDMSNCSFAKSSYKKDCRFSAETILLQIASCAMKLKTSDVFLLKPCTVH